MKRWNFRNWFARSRHGQASNLPTRHGKWTRRSTAIVVSSFLAIGGVGVHHLYAQSNPFPATAILSNIPIEHPDFLTLLELSQRYGCPVNYADGSAFGGRPLTQDEYYQALVSCDQTAQAAMSDEDQNRLATLFENVLGSTLMNLDEASEEVVGGQTGSTRGDIMPLSPTTSALPPGYAPQRTGGISLYGSSGLPEGFIAQPSPNQGGWVDDGFDREGYNPIEENIFFNPMMRPLSTFSIDVDRASYSNVRRFINNGQRPPIDAVRLEELINYFTYNYPEPTNNKPFSVTTEISDSPWSSQRKLVRIGLQGKRISTDNLPASNLVFLLDVSGSMDEPNKLPLLKSAMRLLVNELDHRDKVSIVVYAGSAGVVLEPTQGDEKDQILDAIEQLSAGGSTAGGEGIELAYRLAQAQFIEGGNNRVILATDGDFNVGVSSDAELIRLIEDKREHDIFLTVLGFGTGNYQDAKMEQLANHGNGNYAYIDNILEAKKVLVNEIGATLLTIAKDVKIQVEFNPEKVQAYRLIGYENRLLRDEEFNDDTRDAGELGAGHSVTALYEVIPAGVDPDVTLPTVDGLRYQTPEPANDNSANSSDRIDRTTRYGEELMWVKLRYKEPTGDVSQLIEMPVIDRGVPLARSSEDFRFAASVALFGMLLRDSEFVGSGTLAEVRSLAQGAQGRDQEGYRSEFLRLVDAYGRLDRPQ